MTTHQLFNHDPESSPQGIALVAFIHQILEEHLAENVVTIDMTQRSVLFDTLIIASGRSVLHIWAITKKLLERLRQAKIKNVSVEGRPGSEWILLDIGEVVVHIFLPELRMFYDIERFSSVEKDATTL